MRIRPTNIHLYRTINGDPDTRTPHISEVQNLSQPASQAATLDPDAHRKKSVRERTLLTTRLFTLTKNIANPSVVTGLTNSQSSVPPSDAVQDGMSQERLGRAGPSTERGSSRIIQKGLDSLRRSGRVPNSAAISIEDIRRLDFPIPGKVYRATVGHADEVRNDGVERSGFSNKSGDDYLADIIKHSGRSGGSGGAVLSLSAQITVAKMFLAPGKVLIEVDTTRNSQDFKTMANILLNDADRLVDAGLVSQGTVLRALENLLNMGEEELFYVKGDIPPNIVKVKGLSETD